MVRESPRSAQAGCAETNFLMKNLSTPCDKTGRVPLVLPLLRLSIFSIDGDFRLSSRAELAFFRERSRGINAKRFLPSRAFSGTSLRVDPSRRSLRLAPRSLGRDDKKRRRENRQSPQGGELNTSGAEKAERANESARCESKTKEASLSEVRKDCSQRNRFFRTLIGKQPTQISKIPRDGFPPPE